MTDMQITWTKGEFTISTDPEKLQIEVIQQFLANESYWAQNRTEQQTLTAIKNSLPFGVYKGENLIGFARVVSDHATFAYVGDVFILNEFRGRGLSKWLMDVIIGHPDLQDLRRWILATRDAHGLYEHFGFHALVHPDRWMERPAPDAY
jgi:GNAT superfamily N-acetyltransferase